MTKKKNVLMRSAGVLLALVLVTSCFVGSTFAKYTVSESGYDIARVAKFGVHIEANGTMFAKEYDEGTTVKSVISTDKVVAPGTSGEMVRMAISGTPEVAVNVQYAATLTLNENWKDKDGKFYCPLRITIATKDGNEHYYGLDYTSATLFAQAVQDAISGFNAQYAAGTDLSTITADDSKLAPTVSWTWAYEGSGTHTVTQTDEKDTYLGDQAAAGYPAEIQLTVATTVTQID